MAWVDDLLPASLDGIEFEPLERRVRGGTDFAGARYQGVSGQDTEPTGLRPRIFDLTVELFADVDEEAYPDKYLALHDLVMNADKVGEVEYVDPVFGPIPVIIAEWGIDENAGKQDGATFSFTLEEREADPVTFIDAAFTSPRGKAQALATSLDAELAALGITEDEITDSFDDAGFPLTDEEGASFPEIFITLTDSVFDTLENARVTAADLAWEVDRYRARVDRIIDFDPAKEASGWEAFYSAMNLVATVTKVANVVGGDEEGSDEAELVAYEVVDTMSAQDISLDLYGTPDRADAIIARNPVPNPMFYPAGSVLQVDPVTF